jgi:hypothetical protein
VIIVIKKLRISYPVIPELSTPWQLIAILLCVF